MSQFIGAFEVTAKLSGETYQMPLLPHVNALPRAIRTRLTPNSLSTASPCRRPCAHRIREISSNPARLDRPRSKLRRRRYLQRTPRGAIAPSTMCPRRCPCASSPSRHQSRIMQSELATLSLSGFQPYLSQRPSSGHRTSKAAHSKKRLLRHAPNQSPGSREKRLALNGGCHRGE